jgi:hypothetical protein
MKNAKNKEKLSKHSVRVRDNDWNRFTELAELFDSKQGSVFQYLVSLESSRIGKTAFLVEQKLKQWLFLGYPKTITLHGLRYADYGLTESNKPRIVSRAIAKNVYDLYEKEINDFNKQFDK